MFNHRQALGANLGSGSAQQKIDCVLTDSSFRLAWGNYCFDPGLTTSIAGFAFSGGSGHTDVDNLLTPQLSDRGTATGSGATGFYWVGDATANGGEFPIDVVGLLNFDATVVSVDVTEWRVDIWDAADTLIYSGPWTDLVPKPTDGFPSNQYHFLPSTVMGSKVRWLFNQATGTTIVTAGAAWVSALWTTARGIKDEFAYDPLDAGQMGLSKGLQGYPENGTRGWAFEFSLARFSLVEAFGDPEDSTLVDVQRLLHEVGKTEFVIAWARTKIADVLSPHLIHRMGVYGSVTQLGSIRHISGDDYECGTMRVESLR